MIRVTVARWNTWRSAIPTPSTLCVLRLREYYSLKTIGSSQCLRPALVFEERHYTLPQLEALADGLATSLRERGVTAGERVALMASNRPEFVVALHAIWRLAAVVVLISPAWKRHEVEHALALTNPSHAVGDHEVLSDLMPMLHLDEPIRPGARSPHRTPASADADAVLAFSSGTTGLPKAVRHTHHSLQSRRGALARGAGLDCPRPHSDRHAAVAHSRLAQHHDGVADRRVDATASPIRHRPHAAAHPRRPDHRRDGRRANRFGHRLASAARVLRSVLAAVHHVGRDAGQRRASPRPSPGAPASAGFRPTAPPSCR